MRKLLLLFTLVPCLVFGQTTLIPDANFEQRLIDLGYDTGPIDGSVPTGNIDTVTYLDVGYKSISDLTGIQDFTALDILYCGENQLISLDVSNNTSLIWLNCTDNQLTSLDVSNNTDLTILGCGANQLTNLDVSNNTALTELSCDQNALTSLDVSNNTALTYLNCGTNQLTTLDLSNNTALTVLICLGNLLTSLDVSNNTLLEALYCADNQLICLNINNGYNQILQAIYTDNNTNLTCIEVDDTTYSNAFWIGSDFAFDSQTSFSEDCNNPCSSTTGIPELPTKPKHLLTITDVLGRTTQPIPNTLLFYIYEDGSVEKRIQLER